MILMLKGYSRLAVVTDNKQLRTSDCLLASLEQLQLAEPKQ